MSKRRCLLSSLALGALVAVSAPAYAEARQVQQYDIPAQDLGGRYVLLRAHRAYR